MSDRRAAQVEELLEKDLALLNADIGDRWKPCKVDKESWSQSKIEKKTKESEEM